jgi:hypothetical protein
MNARNFFVPLDLSESFLDNINKNRYQNNNEEKHNNYQNTNIDPPFRYYTDDTNLNLTPQFMPKFTYKNKSLFGAEKPIQTEHDQTQINEPYLNKHFGYTDYGNYKIANQSLPEANKHKRTPKNNLFELV